MDEVYLKSQIKKLVSQYMRRKYKSEETISCRFDMYRIDIEHDDKIDKYHWAAELTKREYSSIMRTLLEYPNLTFQDLPHYISLKIYEKLILHLRFPYFGNVCGLYIDPSRSLPVAVEMTALQQDAHEIAGEDMYSFTLSSEQNNIHNRIDVDIRLKKIEISTYRYSGLSFFIMSKYIDIDALEVERALGVDNYRGIENALNIMYQKIAEKEDPGQLWLIHWLDENSISYTMLEEGEYHGGI